MKKKIIIVGLSVMLCMLGGCLDVTPLTDGEMDVVAEYAASLLLKYDTNYKTPLYYEDERLAMLTPTPTPTPTLAPTATPTPSPQPDTEGAFQENTATEVEPTAEPTVTPTPIPAYNEEETTKQLTELFGEENIIISCEGYVPMKSVQSTEYFSLVAKEGRKYAVVGFLLENTSEQDLVFDASDKGLEYSLDVNTKTVSRVSLSMLENDLQYMKIAVPAKGTAKAVLVFEIEDIDIETMHLIVEDKEENVVFAKLE